MFLKTFIYQFQGYVTNYRKTLLQSWYGAAALRNVMFVKPDDKLYFIDNNQAELCLSHPDFSQVQNAPTGQGVNTWDELQDKPLVFPPENHDHDDRYYTESEVDTALANKSDISHTHEGDSGGLVLVSSADASPDYLGAKLLAGDDITITETEMGPGYKQLGLAGGPNLLRRTSPARPGLTKLYRRDNDSNYNLQFYDDGSGKWWLRAYNDDTLHANTVRVGYADAAGVANSAASLGGYGAEQLRAIGTVVQRTSDFGIGTAATTVIQWSSVLYNTASGSNGYWNGSTRLTPQQTGWYHIWLTVNIDVTTSSNQLFARLLRDGTYVVAQHNERKPSDTGNSYFSISCTLYLSSANYLEAYAYSSGTGSITTISGLGLFGMIFLGA